MNLTLAVVKACSDDGCSVQVVKDGPEIKGCYSGLVKDRIQIRPHQLVAIDRDAHPNEIVWRWVRGKVDKFEGESVIVDDGKCQLIPAGIPREMDLTLHANDEIWWCSLPQDIEVHDKIIDGEPEKPDQLLTYIKPIIEAIYANS